MRRPRGFSLLEVILAFALLSVGLGILIAILSGGLAQVRNAGDATEATLHAQSLLEQVGVLEPIEPGVERGDFDRGRYRWELAISEVEDPAPRAESGADVVPIESVGLQPVGAPVLYRVQLDVSWGEDETPRTLRFATLRVRYPSPGQGLQ
ncbi:MAG TPA: prepilin-type N-terminal cleavage/methylation domain-containing protein [Arenimonas sp.]|uniref:type IV pilus modification PilV family protein n=1 Tax=Arenimonas sp. TaxID=1872635 RepID=UPI002D7E885A|nr:prepilin-type N-terminal cleavage/methylation domain-containing protein [Arenimonas sp.]HEU0151906.1 prepilin-type N-terminal cleavage/methylation domain-containing protein [Arenimonas sp.]